MSDQPPVQQPDDKPIGSKGKQCVDCLYSRANANFIWCNKYHNSPYMLKKYVSEDAWCAEWKQK